MPVEVVDNVAVTVFVVVSRHGAPGMKIAMLCMPGLCEFVVVIAMWRLVRMVRRLIVRRLVVRIVTMVSSLRGSYWIDAQRACKDSA